MSSTSHDVIGIGNAIVDVIFTADEAFLKSADLEKGMMKLVDLDQAAAIYDAITPNLEVSGGSAANTLAGIASLGGRAAYIGKVRNDPLGETFRRDIRKTGVDYKTQAATEGPSTARCLVIVTPDAERTMSTYLGISSFLSTEDVDVDAIRNSQITYLEGYLFDPPEAKQAFFFAAEEAHLAERQVALSLSDSFCVDRHRAEFLDLVEGYVDILFANEGEISALYETTSFEDAISAVRSHCQIAVLTRGARGACIVSGADIVDIKPALFSEVLDTTGAGDLFAAGFLFGITNGRSIEDSGNIGALAAAEIIGHFGARPEVSLAQLLLDKGL